MVFVWICAGSEGTKLTDGVVFGAIRIGFELILAFGSAAKVAVIVTDVPVDVTGGAVYTAVAPLAVCTGLVQPQPPGTVLSHCTDQATPPGVTSFVTATLTDA